MSETTFAIREKDPIEVAPDDDPTSSTDTLPGVSNADMLPFELEFEGVKIIRVFGGGANTEHFAGALRDLMEQGYIVHLFDVKDFINPDDVPHHEFFNLKDLEKEGEESERVERALGMRALAVYLSTPPGRHVLEIKRELDNVATGLVGVVIVPKPAVENGEQVIEVDEALADAEVRRRDLWRQLGKTAVERALIVIHEHYDVKGPWEVVRRRLPDIIDILGPIVKMTVDIQEAPTFGAEMQEKDGKPGRTVAAFGSGAYSDLAPHATTYLYEAMMAINKSSRYETTSDADYSLQRYQYAEAQKEGFSPEFDTSFHLTCDTNTIDLESDGKETPLHIELRCGKGVGGTVEPGEEPGRDPKKMVRFEFEHPDRPGETVELVINLDSKINAIEEIPPEVAHLFSERQFKDNGYGAVVADSLSGRNPERLQDWKTARQIVLLIERILKESAVLPQRYSSKGGRYVEEIDEASLLPAIEKVSLIKQRVES
jgi:hypothetical protein